MVISYRGIHPVPSVWKVCLMEGLTGLRSWEVAFPDYILQGRSSSNGGRTPSLICFHSVARVWYVLFDYLVLSSDLEVI